MVTNRCHFAGNVGAKNMASRFESIARQSEEEAEKRKMEERQKREAREQAEREKGK